MKTPRTGYYSLLQYCPDLARVEAANIGVILFSPEDGYLRARTAPANDRVRKFFGATAGDLDQISAMKRMFERRLEVESGNIRDLAAFRRFASLLANELLVTPPRAVRVEEPDADLMQLFEELVTGRVRRELPPESGILSELRLVLDVPKFETKVRHNVSVGIPVLGETLTVPFAFQNGKLNLIEPHEFTQRRETDILREAFKTAVQGHLLYNHPDSELGALRLVVVAAFRDAAAAHRQRVADVLREHDVTFYDEANLEDLTAQIEQTAH